MLLKIIRSTPFPTLQRRATGLQLDGRNGSPFLDKGITLEYLYMSGMWLCLSRRLYKEVNGFAMDFETYFIIVLLIPSGPEAVCMLSVSSMSITSFSEMIV